MAPLTGAGQEIWEHTWVHFLSFTPSTTLFLYRHFNFVRRLLHLEVVLELLTGVAFRCMLLAARVSACYSGIGLLGTDCRLVWDQRLIIGFSLLIISGGNPSIVLLIDGSIVVAYDT